IRVVSGATSGTVEQMYRLSVTPFSDVESEPNNTIGAPGVLPALGASTLRVHGNTASTAAAHDFHLLPLATPLAAGEAIEVRGRHLNLRTSAHLTVEVFDALEASLARSAQVAGSITVGASGDEGPFTISIRGANATRWDPYELEITRIAAFADLE